MTQDQQDYLNKFRVRQASASLCIPEKYASDDSEGFQGMFRFPWKDKMIRVIASNGMGWEHVSVSIERDNRTPSWEVMCTIKDLFWEPEQAVVQFHPPLSQYVNHHPGCLHLWRPTTHEIRLPDPMLVGIRKKVAPAQDKW